MTLKDLKEIFNNTVFEYRTKSVSITSISISKYVKLIKVPA